VHPWEVSKLSAIVSNTGRKLLDMYGDSLKFVNNLLNEAFGASARKVPAHMPHMIDKRIMTDLQTRWPDKIDATSSHKLRQGNDMQFAFSYFYFLIHQRAQYDIQTIWKEFLDIDNDGKLNDNELRNLAIHLKGTPLPHNCVSDLKHKLLNLSTDGIITFEVLSNSKVREDIDKQFGKKLKNKHQEFESDEVAFLMIGNNYTNVEKSLDGIREKRQKFICLNDNMNHSNPSAKEVVRVLKEFYDALFPLPSSFELPEGVINEYLYLDELVQARTVEVEENLTPVYLVVVTVVVSVFCIVWKISGRRFTRPSREKRFMKLINA